MKKNKQSHIDLWLFIGSIIVFLYLLVMTVFHIKNEDVTFIERMEWITIPVFMIGAFIPMMVAFRYISKKMTSKTLAILTIVCSLLTSFLIGYTKLI